LVFAGDEIGLTGIDGDGARRPMPWERAQWDIDVLDGYRALGELRRSSRALRHGGLRWVHADDDVLVYLRESTDERLLVQVSRAEHRPVVLAGAMLDGELGDRRYGPADATFDGDAVVLPTAGPAAYVWDIAS
jgi:alpha-glucosidase